MARPSVKKERTEEILHAYERCIALYGVEGATLQKIAEEADIARPLLRHHVGNSDDLLNMALKRFVERSEDSARNAYSALPDKCCGEDFVNLLFQATPSKTKHNDTMIAAAFIYAAQTHPDIKKHMQSWLMSFMDDFSAQLQKSYPEADNEKVESVSAGIIGIYFNVESLVPLGPNKILREQSRQAALSLLTTLEQKG